MLTAGGDCRRSSNNWFYSVSRDGVDSGDCSSLDKSCDRRCSAGDAASESASCYSAQDERKRLDCYSSTYEQFLCDEANDYAESGQTEKLREIDQILNPLRACRGLLSAYAEIEPQDARMVAYFNSFKTIKEVPPDQSEQCFDLLMKYASKAMGKDNTE